MGYSKKETCRRRRLHELPGDAQVPQGPKVIITSMEPINHNGGSLPTIRAASILVWDFNFDDTTARRLFEPYNQRCQPPWNESEIAHKFASARTNPHPKPAGYLWLKRRWKIHGPLNTECFRNTPGENFITQQ